MTTYAKALEEALAEMDKWEKELKPELAHMILPHVKDQYDRSVRVMNTLRRALRIAAMVEAGTHVMVPKEPTEGMLQDGYGNLYRLETTLGKNYAIYNYKSMINNAPEWEG